MYYNELEGFKIPKFKIRACSVSILCVILQQWLPWMNNEQENRIHEMQSPAAVTNSL